MNEISIQIQPDECCVCLEEEPFTVLLPCNHSVLCEKCSQRIRMVCPICRCKIQTIISATKDGKLEKIIREYKDKNKDVSPEIERGRRNKRTSHILILSIYLMVVALILLILGYEVFA